MSKLNHESAANLNLGREVIKNSRLLSSKQNHEFSEELSDGGERNQYIAGQKRK